MSDLEITKENFYEMLERREVRDILNAERHPISRMDDSGYTYLDYVLYKTKQRKRPLQRIINDLNDLFKKGKHIQFFY